MSTPETTPDMPDALLDDAAMDDADDTTDPETTAHEDPDPETLAHAGDADEEVLAGQLAEGRLEGHEDGRLLD